MIMDRPTIEEDGDLFVLRSPYDPDFVNELKAAVPSYDREWDPAEKCWSINLDHQPVVMELVEEFFGEVEVG